MLKKPSLAAWAFLCRSLALAFILYQMRLFAGEIADTPVFLAMLLAGFVFPLLLSRLSGPARDPLFDAKTVPGPFFRNYAKTLPCLLVLALVPWAARFLIAAPRWAFSGTAVTLDSLLLNFDRNTFVSLLPFYWAAFSTWGILRARRFLKADIAASDLLFFVLFCFRRSDTLALYRWPVLMIALFAFVFFLQLSSLCLASPRALRLRAKEAAAALAAFLVIALLGSVFLVRPSQEKAAEQGGGLLQPNMFNFDFSQVLRLDPEISMNNDLMLIVKKENADAHIFLRRYTLSEYSAKRGFYRGESDERAHPQNLPDVKTALPTVEILEAEETPQEYYLVNFDSNAFIGMNMPVEVTPFERWDASSFSAAYAVRSLTSSAVPFDLMEAVRGTPGKADLLPPTLGLSEDEYRLYTDYGGNKKIADYAEEICWQVEGYWDRILAVYDHLKNGDYRYSLRPGIAPDGDQLSWFLFQSKKGYCSYFAYAFSLLLRSMGVPCRAAAGFFINPEEKAFDYYPVSANMAHAWVEVWYPGYGWIEYDPTTELLADGEEFRFAGPPTDIFEKLMKEILENRSRLRAKEGAAKDNQNSNFDYFREAAVEFFRKNGLFVLAALIIILFLTLRLGPLFRLPFARGARKKARLLWAQALRVLALAGYRRRRGTLEPDWARGLASAGFDLAPLHESVTASRFAPAFEKDDARAALAAYRAFASSFRAMVPLHRRVLGWALPPLALLLRPAKKDAGRGGGLALLLFAVIFVCLPEGGGAQNKSADEAASADSFYLNGRKAEEAQLFEAAVGWYMRGEKAYPADSRFPWALGRLYFEKRLYRLAWDEFRHAETINAYDTTLLYMLSETAAHLNKDREAAAYLERLIAYDPLNIDAIENLGWRYFKIHRSAEGEALLLKAVSEFGANADLEMTLGTIYADLFRYEESKKWYLAAIESSTTGFMGNNAFAAVAHYNLALLEDRFYQFNLAFERTNQSLQTGSRASGRLARGELFVRRMELSAALADCEAAREMDESPLAKVNLADTLRIAGRLEEARRYAEDCLNAQDESWMLNYGLNPVSYRRDLHEILRDCYEGLANTEDFRAASGPLDWLESRARKIRYSFKARVHRLLLRKYSLAEARDYGPQSYSGQTPHLDALKKYYGAFEDYPRRALRYLRESRAFEGPLIPRSGPAYDFEEGKLKGAPRALLETLDRFDPIWERDLLAETYAELSLRFGVKTEEGRDAAERLFALNRGALRQKGIALPAEIDASGAAPRLERTLRGLAKKAGVLQVSLDRAPRYTLTFASAGQNAVQCALRDNVRGRVLFEKTLPLGKGRTERALFSRALGELLFGLE